MGEGELALRPVGGSGVSIDGLEDGSGGRRAHFGIAEGVLVLLEKVNERRFAVGAAVLQRSEAVRGCLEKMAASRGGRHVGVIRTGGFLAFERLGRELGKIRDGLPDAV